MATELEIYELINSATSVGELKDFIKNIWGTSGMLAGRTEPFSVPEMLVYVDFFAEEFWDVVSGAKDKFSCLPTRRYGIRQQLCMILLNLKR
jgi:hypothetical protein